MTKKVVIGLMLLLFVFGWVAVDLYRPVYKAYQEAFAETPDPRANDRFVLEHKEVMITGYHILYIYIIRDKKTINRYLLVGSDNDDGGGISMVPFNEENHRDKGGDSKERKMPPYSW